MYKIEIDRKAFKELLRIPKSDQNNIRKAINKLSKDPRPNGCKKLKDGILYRIRCGNYRILYRIEDENLCILVIRIGNRKNIYK